MKVKLHFTLAGKSNMWKRHLPKGILLDSTDKDTLEYVKETVANQFGDRAMVIVNEHSLSKGVGSYPEYYVAGWFVSEDTNPVELVIVDHGRTMKDAQEAMLASVQVIDWTSYAVKI